MAESANYEREWNYESNSSESSESLSDDDLSYFPWLEKVEPNGELFYIEGRVLSCDEENCLNTVQNVKDNQKTSNLGKSNFSAAEKFKKWMKKRKNKVQKPFPLFKSNKYDENTDGTVQYNPLSFYSRDVFVEVIPQHTISHKENLARELLGLELGSEENSEFYITNKVKILGFTSDQKISDVKIGDWLHSINDEIVDSCNIDEVLLKLNLPCKVKLTVLSSFHENYDSSNCLLNHRHISDEFLGTYDVVAETKPLFHNNPGGVFFLKLLGGSEDETMTNETIYNYPDEASTLSLIKGTFITLDHIITDVASPLILSCSLQIQESTVHVGFLKEKNSLLLLAVPASCATEKEVQYFVKNIANLLKFQFSSLEIAFSSENSKSKLDKFFSMFFKHFLFKKSESLKWSPPHLYEILPSAHWMPLFIELKTEIDDTLNELESSDYDCSSDGFFENQRIYNILGSCLFYKGYLLSNHLLKNDFLDIHLFLQYNHLLLLTKMQAVSEIIVWKEVYPSRFQETYNENSENSCRYFLLVTAMNHCVISVLLEAGGCALEAEANPPPEPFYVEEVQNTLLILHSYGIISAIEKSLHFCLPPLSSPDAYLKGQAPSVSISSYSAVDISPRNLQCASSHSSLSCDKCQADGKSDIESDYSDTSMENSSFSSLKSSSYNGPSGSVSNSPGSSVYSSNYQLRNMGVSTLTSESIYTYTPRNISSLFHYLHMDPVEGIFLAPFQEEKNIHHSSLISDILLNFHRSCVYMRSVFSRSLRNKEILGSNLVTKFGINDFLRCSYEQGVLFSCIEKDKSKQRNPLNFWVIGRLFFAPEPREVYVCYHDSIQQDTVELAFQLGFGLSP